MNKKQCTRCKETLALDMFYRQKDGKNGLTPHCKKCHSEARGHSYTPKEQWAEGHRACTKCGEIKPFSEFGKNKNGRFGLDSRCRQCKSIAKAKEQWAEGHRACTKCGEIKPFSEFNKAKNGRFGLDSRCCQCKSRAKPRKTIIDGYLECYVCKESKPATLEYFYYSQTSKLLDNLAGTCKVCIRKRTQEWQKKKHEEDPDYSKKRYHKHREANRKRSKAYYHARVKTDPNYNKQRYWARREQTLRRSRQYYLENREVVLAYSRQWRQDNPERYRETNRRWAEDNPEAHKVMMQAAWQRRRARKKALPHDLTLEEWQYCLDYWENQCAVCGVDEDIHADHWIPLSHEDCPGTVAENMIPLCSHCNKTKHAIEAERWLTEKFGDEIASEKLAEVEAYFEHVIERQIDSES